jgi:hypothetical protein
MATQFSAMNSRQAKIARSWMLALGPVGTSCGTSALMKLKGRMLGRMMKMPNRALYAVLLDVRLNGCRLRMIRVTPWFKTALKVAGARIFE